MLPWHARCRFRQVYTAAGRDWATYVINLLECAVNDIATDPVVEPLFQQGHAWCSDGPIYGRPLPVQVAQTRVCKDLRTVFPKQNPRICIALDDQPGLWHVEQRQQVQLHASV